MAARRAKLAQRNNDQGLQGNPDACHPRRGSACNVTVYKTGGDARLVFANQTQRTAAMSPRIGGSRVGEAPGPSFPPFLREEMPHGAPVCASAQGRGEAPAPQGPRQQAEAGPPAGAAMTYRQKEVEKWRKSNASSAESRP